jgi:c-di-AMP phosphodiesterase-like protein
LPALFEATVGNAEALLLAMYGDSFRVLDEDDKSTAMNNVIDNIKRREREMKRFLSSQEALSSVTKEYGTDISRLTLPF